tara:strand:- start:134690 stop:137581 length:2892 start_codon:yes stop_codon:yes gene_type:complete
MNYCNLFSHLLKSCIRPRSIILYFCLFEGVQSIAQENESVLFYEPESYAIKSPNNIIEGNYYLVSDTTYLASTLGSSSSLEVIKRYLTGSYIVYLDPHANSILFKSEDIQPFHNIDDFWKTPNKNKINTKSILNGDYLVSVRDESKYLDFTRMQSMLSTIGLQDGLFKLSVDSVGADKIINNIAITYIEKVAAKAESEVNVLDLNLHPNKINTIHAYFPNLNGAEELVSLKEPLYEVNNIDVRGRYINTGFESTVLDNHALEMATIISGNGNSSLNGFGVAPKSFHTSSSNESIIPDPIQYFVDNDIQTQNHSYGTEIESFYGIGASLYDKQVYDAPQILHIFSAGNSGLESADHGKYQNLTGYANITGNFKLAKNVLTIGAVDTTMNTIVLNSNGPAFDGRIKPELVAYSMTGTSNAAAYVSGVSVLLQQSYRQKFNSEMPAALTKAILINGADDIGVLGPDHKTGYGSLNAQEALLQLENGHFLEDDLIASEQSKYKIAIPENAINFRATLVWTDPPANPNDEIALVNDLNLHVRNQKDQKFLPWVLSTTPNIESLSAAASKGVDHLNNVEQVYIENVESDTLEIVISTEIPLNSRQNYSIVYDWEIENEFSWTSPTFKDNIPYNGETVSHLRWESSYSKGQKGDLYFKLVSEESWRAIAENVSLQTENFRWDPEMVNDFAQLKMEVEGSQYLSDTFSISAPLRLNVGFNCTDSLSFYWKSIEGVDYYTLFNLQENEMRLLVSTMDTSITVSKSDLKSSFLKVQAFKDDKPLIQGGAIDYNLQASNCFLQSYFVEAVQGEGIFHNIQLSSLVGIKDIQIQKMNALESNWDLLIELNPNSFKLEFLEEQPINGFNESRVIVNLDNGESVVSEMKSTYFVKDEEFILYPNPIWTEDDLKVFAKEPKTDAVINFYNLQGLEIISFPIPNDRNFLDLSSFEEGMYFYRISEEGEQYAQGKILIQN